MLRARRLAADREGDVVAVDAHVGERRPRDVDVHVVVAHLDALRREREDRRGVAERADRVPGHGAHRDRASARDRRGQRQCRAPRVAVLLRERRLGAFPQHDRHEAAHVPRRPVRRLPLDGHLAVRRGRGRGDRAAVRDEGDGPAHQVGRTGCVADVDRVAGAGLGHEVEHRREALDDGLGDDGLVALRDLDVVAGVGRAGPGQAERTSVVGSRRDVQLRRLGLGSRHIAILSISSERVNPLPRNGQSGRLLAADAGLRKLSEKAGLIRT